MQNRLIIVLLVIIILFLLYVYYSNQANANKITNDANESDPAQILDNFQGEAEKKQQKKVRFCKNLDIRDTDLTTNYGSHIDTIDDRNTDKAMDNLLDQKNVTIKQSSDEYIYTPVHQTDQEKMFDELENEIKKQYSEIYQKNGFFKSVERPDIPTALANDEKTNSELNPIINPQAFEPTAADISGEKTVWELYDEKTTNNFKKYSNLDQISEKENKDLYNIEKPNEYGGTAFDTYGQ